MDITKGEWVIRKYEEDDEILIGIENKNGTFASIAKVTWYGEDDCNSDAAEADAHLIAEAGAVANETGFTPRQLAEQKVNLREALKNMITQYKKYTELDCERCWEIIQARQAIAESEA